MISNKSFRIVSIGIVWYNSLQIGRRCWISTGLWLCNWVFMVSGELLITSKGMVRLMWRIKSGRVIVSIELMEMALLGLHGDDYFLNWYLVIWLRRYHGQVLCCCLNLYLTCTTIFCILFPCSKFFPQGFIWQGFLMRWNGWVITYLVFILHQDCTRSSDDMVDLLLEGLVLLSD